MTVGQAYRGDLPPPTGTMIPPPHPPMASLAAKADTPGSASWSDVLHFVAQAALHRPVLGVLPAKGSPATTPRWVACEDKPEAVLVDLPSPNSTMLAGSAAETLSAMETMGVALVFLSQRPADVAGQRAKLGVLGLTVPVADQRWFSGSANDAVAHRATIAARYCVAAVVGSEPAAFPNAVPPGAAGSNPGWFLIR